MKHREMTITTASAYWTPGSYVRIRSMEPRGFNGWWRVVRGDGTHATLERPAWPIRFSKRLAGWLSGWWRWSIWAA